MSTPEKTSTQWKQLAATSAMDSDGTLHTSLHIVEIHSGEDFVVTLSGRAKADTGYWVGAVNAALAIYRNAAGEAPLPNTTLVPPNAHH